MENRFVKQSMPQDTVDRHELETITLDYRRECQQDDVVDSLTSPEPVMGNMLKDTNGYPGRRGENECIQYLHLLRLTNDGSEINRGRTKWRKKQAHD